MRRAKLRRTARAKGRGKYDRAQSTAERREEQRARLLGAAAQVLSTKGFANASVRDIVDAAGMSRRTFYEHFDDLRDVLFTLHDQAADLTFRYVRERIEEKADPMDKVRAGIEAFLTVIAQHGDLARVLFREMRAAGPRFEAR